MPIQRDDLLDRLGRLQVSSVCDADKSIVPLPSSLRPLFEGVTIVGPAYLVQTDDDHLTTYCGVTRAEPGSILLIATNNKHEHKAIIGGLFTNEARRRGLRGVVVLGNVRDLRDMRRVGLPIWFQGTNAAAGGMSKLPDPELSELRVESGQIVRNGDIIMADDDGVIVMPREQAERAIAKAEEIEAKEGAIVRNVSRDVPLSECINAEEYIEALKAGKPIPFEYHV